MFETLAKMSKGLQIMYHSFREGELFPGDMGPCDCSVEAKDVSPHEILERLGLITAQQDSPSSIASPPATEEPPMATMTSRRHEGVQKPFGKISSSSQQEATCYPPTSSGPSQNLDWTLASNPHTVAERFNPLQLAREGQGYVGREPLNHMLLHGLYNHYLFQAHFLSPDRSPMV